MILYEAFLELIKEKYPNTVGKNLGNYMKKQFTES